MTRRLKYGEHPSLFEQARMSEEPLKYMGTPLEFDVPPCYQGAYRMGQDQYRCGKCGIVWDVDEARPPCNVIDDSMIIKGEPK